MSHLFLGATAIRVGVGAALLDHRKGGARAPLERRWNTPLGRRSMHGGRGKGFKRVLISPRWRAFARHPSATPKPLRGNAQAICGRGSWWWWWPWHMMGHDAEGSETQTRDGCMPRMRRVPRSAPARISTISAACGAAHRTEPNHGRKARAAAQRAPRNAAHQVSGRRPSGAGGIGAQPTRPDRKRACPMQHETSKCRQAQRPPFRPTCFDREAMSIFAKASVSPQLSFFTFVCLYRYPPSLCVLLSFCRPARDAGSAR